MICSAQSEVMLICSSGSTTSLPGAYPSRRRSLQSLPKPHSLSSALLSEPTTSERLLQPFTKRILFARSATIRTSRSRRLLSAWVSTGLSAGLPSTRLPTRLSTTRISTRLSSAGLLRSKQQGIQLVGWNLCWINSGIRFLLLCRSLPFPHMSIGLTGMMIMILG